MYLYVFLILLVSTLFTEQEVQLVILKLLDFQFIILQNLNLEHITHTFL